MKQIILLLSAMAMIAACKSEKAKEKKVRESPAESMVAVFPKPKVDIKTVGILLYDGYAVLDAMGPYHVLSEMMGVRVFFVGRNKGTVTTANNMKVQCDTSIADVKQLDILVIPGGLNETYLATKDTVLLNWIKAIDLNSKYTTSVCTGAWILAATGLLKDKDATTHWYGKKILKDQFGINVKDKRFVKSGKYWTSAGISAGIDMSLELVREIMGDNYAKMAMLDLEYDPQPPIIGGSEKNTDKQIVESTRAMYDSVIETVLHPESTTKPSIFNNKKDPVCGMAITAGAAATVSYKGKTYGFCSAVCKGYFEANPAAYLAKMQ